MTNLLQSLAKISITPEFYKSLPDTPGIYAYFDSKKVIYIGKAINLKRRVSSYFDLDLDVKTRKMISEAKYISIIQVTSEFEALLLESRLIRSYMPHYNIAAKDDKHPLYIKITNDDFPQVKTARKIAENEKNKAFYGPFPSSANVKQVLRMIRRIFPFSDHKIGPRPCLYSHIGLCNPCPSEINQIKDVALRNLAAEKYKKNINKIIHILDGKIDFVVKNLEKEMKLLSYSQKYEEAKMVRDQIERLEYITRPQMPTDYYLENPNLYDDLRRGEVENLAMLVGLKNLKRIECFDIAHLAGTKATASMVVAINGDIDKSEYRHFRIRQPKGNSDYDSMQEVAGRRLKHFSDWGKPNLIIVDGSLGQIAKFKKIIKNVPIVGIAKHPDRLIVDSKTKIKLSGNALNLISRLRDEAHRFARRYHHSLISNSILKSEK
jgi:excinuclease ABC subunit C